MFFSSNLHYNISMTKQTSKSEIYTEYYQNGQKKVEGLYQDIIKNGKWTEWYEYGDIKSEGNYKDGKKNGMWTEFHDYGKNMGQSFMRMILKSQKVITKKVKKTESGLIGITVVTFVMR